MTKKCKSCNCEKPFSDFHGNGTYGGDKRYKSRCKICTNEKPRNKKNNLIKAHFGAWRCSKCGMEGRPIQFDCHHVRGVKKFRVSQYFRKSKDSEKVFIEELEKCDLLCANCHRLEHDVTSPQKTPSTMFSPPIKVQTNHDLIRVL